MMNRIFVMASAGAASVAIACLLLFGAGWLSEVLAPLLVMHARPIAFVVTPMLGTFGMWFAIAVALRHQRTKIEEEPLKPRIRNGRIG